AGPSRAPGSIFVKDPAAPDGSADRAQGATVYSVAPDSTYFFSVKQDGSGYVLDYLDRFVPAKGSLDFRFGYATALTTAAVKGFARQLEDQYAAPNTGRAQSTIVELLAKTRKAGAKRGQHGVVVDSGQALACPLGGRACTAKLAAAGKPGKVGTATVKAAAGKRGALKFTLNS